MHINLEKTSVNCNLKEKIINKIIEINDCNKSKDKRVLSQILKNQEVELFNKVRSAKGANKTNTLTIIYLKEYEKIRFNKDKLRVPFIKPSIENISILPES